MNDVFFLSICFHIILFIALSCASVEWKSLSTSWMPKQYFQANGAGNMLLCGNCLSRSVVVHYFSYCYYCYCVWKCDCTVRKSLLLSISWHRWQYLLAVYRCRQNKSQSEIRKILPSRPMNVLLYSDSVFFWIFTHKWLCLRVAPSKIAFFPRARFKWKIPFTRRYFNKQHTQNVLSL